ncbi:MAG: hypothetical protein JOZ38_09150 [Candidatus Eremiobacteraeota bacterium]|nr:hypothetical protein [Candidatus Eremiobacteraeota bacterium]
MHGVAVGADVGGTTMSVIASRDGVPGEVHSLPGTTPTIDGVDVAGARIAAGLVKALRDAAPDALAIGAAGAGRANVSEGLQRAISTEFPRARVRIVDDAQIALRAAVPEGTGVALVAGTGSIAYAEHEGRSFRAGGDGYLIGDEGSGFALGRAAAQQLARYYDERVPRDELIDALERHLGVTSRAELLQRIYAGERRVAQIAELAAVVIERADAGVRSANKLVQTSASELGELVKAVVRQAGLHNIEFPLAFSGGILARNSLLTFLLETRLQNDLPNATILKANVPPYLGALRIAEGMLS